MGVASGMQALSGLVRLKVLALLLGPVGVGIYGLMFALNQTAAVFGTMGQDMSGPRQIARAEADGAEGDDTGQAIWAVALLLMGLAAVCGLVFFALSGRIAIFVGRPQDAAAFGWLSLVLVVAVLAVIPAVILQGLREIGLLAKANIWAALGAMVFGSAAVLVFGQGGIVALILSAPGGLLLAGLAGLRRVERRFGRPRMGRVLAIQRQLVARGFPFMLVAVTAIGTAFAARGVVQLALGEEALGLYTAATTVGVTYLALILGALAADYLPGLSAAIHDPAEASRLVAERVEMVQLIVGPVSLFVFAAAPWVMAGLFSATFVEAAPVLQLTILADMLRLVVWPVGFVLLARGEGMVHFWIEATVQVVFLTLTYVFARHFGLVAAGLAFPVAAAVAVMLTLGVVQRRLSLPRAGTLWRLPLVTLGLAGVAAGVEQVWPTLGMALGVAFAGAMAVFAILRLARLAQWSGPLGGFADGLRRGLQRVGLRQ